ncbi:MAG: hypothetical protein JXB30_00385 [Anaerolineae bacterium]|nr:hypothetical protein [Anaerolineae bacterium]
MTSKNYPTDVVEQARAVLEAWKNIDPDLQVGDLTPVAIEANLDQIGEIYARLDSLESLLTNLRNERDASGEALWDKIKRVRSGMKGIFGDGSSQYEMVGGTRMSERKPPARL